MTNERELFEETLRTLWHAFDGATSISGLQIPEDFSCFMRLHIVTFQRVPFIARLDTRQLDLTKKLWRVPRTIGSRHVIPLSPFALSMVQRAIAIHEGFPTRAVFPACRNKYGETSLHEMCMRFRKAATALSIREFRLYDIHRASRVLLESRPVHVPAEAVDLISGRRRCGIEEIYLGDRLDEKRKILQAWEARLAVITGDDRIKG